MDQSLHEGARTTEAVRRPIQHRFRSICADSALVRHGQPSMGGLPAALQIQAGLKEPP